MLDFLLIITTIQKDYNFTSTSTSTSTSTKQNFNCPYTLNNISAYQNSDSLCTLFKFIKWK